METKFNLPEPDPDAKWSGSVRLPEIGDRVFTGINRIGWCTVTGYFVEAGYQGVQVNPDIVWYGNPDMPDTLHLFGAELKEMPAEQPPPVIPYYMQKAVIHAAKKYPKDYKQRIHCAWMDGSYGWQGLQDYAGALQALRNHWMGHTFLHNFSVRWLDDCIRGRAELEKWARYNEPRGYKTRHLTKAS